MSESLGRSILDSLLEPIAVLDQNGVIGAVNAAWRQFAWINGGGSEASEPIGVNYLSVCEQAGATPNGEEGLLAAQGIRAVMDGRRSEFHLEYSCHSAYEQRWFRMTVTPLFGSPNQVVVSHRNVTHIRRAEIAARLAQAMLRQASEEDPLTDLPNRTLLMQRLEKLVERSHAGEIGFALLFLEMDRFKLINDALGHEAGDEMLIDLGQRLRDAQTAGSFAARFGDYQFVYVACGIGSESEARAVGDRLRSVLAAPYAVHGRDLQTNVSIGIAMSSRTDDANELLRKGSIALFEAKQAAQGLTKVFDQTMHDRLAHRFLIEVALRHAVPRRELSVLYQPVVDIDSGRLMAVETVLRWNNPDLGVMSADEFMPIAEEVGLGVEIDAWLLRESCLQWSHWQQRNAASAPALLSVTAARAVVAAGAALLGGVRSALECARMPATALQIRIAERDLTAERAPALEFIAGLQEMGVRVAMDDFGTGMCSLASLRGYGFDSIKVDKSLIANIGRDPLALAVAQAAIQGIGKLGLVCVAEGIDDPRVLVMLQTMGCARGQGSLFARPMPADQLLTPPDRYT